MRAPLAWSPRPSIVLVVSTSTRHPNSTQHSTPNNITYYLLTQQIRFNNPYPTSYSIHRFIFLCIASSQCVITSSRQRLLFYNPSKIHPIRHFRSIISSLVNKSGNKSRHAWICTRASWSSKITVCNPLPLTPPFFFSGDYIILYYIFKSAFFISFSTSFNINDQTMNQTHAPLITRARHRVHLESACMFLKAFLDTRLYIYSLSPLSSDFFSLFIQHPPTLSWLQKNSDTPSKPSDV